MTRERSTHKKSLSNMTISVHTSFCRNAENKVDKKRRRERKSVHSAYRCWYGIGIEEKK